MPRLSLAILTTNYNTWELCQRCVQACYRNDEGNFERLLVYDDSSRQDFTGKFPNGVILYKGSPNIGLTRGLNVSFGMLSEDIVILLDSDAYPTTPFCDEIREMFERNPDLGLVALRAIGRTGNPTESYTTEPNVWSLLLGQALSGKTHRWLADRSGRVSVFTCAMAVRRVAFDEIGGFDENFDWLDLDHDFSMRMNRSRWSVAIAERVRIFHEGGGTPQLTRHRVLRFYKARWYLLCKFNRLPMRRLVKALIVLRLAGEYLLLLLFGPLLVKDPVSRGDKLQGRKELIRFCSTNY